MSVPTPLFQPRTGPIALNPGTPFPVPMAGPQDMAGMVMGQLAGPGQGYPPQAPPQPPQPGDLGDPALLALEAGAPYQPLDPLLGLPDEKKPGYMPNLDEGVWRELANADEQRYTRLLQRFSRDVMLYRNKYGAKPPGFDPKRELAFRSATVPNIVSKLTNMSAPQDFRYVVPFKDEDSKDASQIVENWLSYLRDCEVHYYASEGGHASLQWDEFFYNHLFGRIACRILPRPDRMEMPVQIDLLDPATLFPVWGGTSEGLVRITHKRRMTAIDVLSTYGGYDGSLYERMKDSIVRKFGYDSVEFSRHFYVERDLTEVWNTWRKTTFWGDLAIQVNEEHKLGYVPFIYVEAKGEPRGMTTPLGRYYYNSPEFDDADFPDDWHAANAYDDEWEKGVSVFHHIVNTNRMAEVVYSLLMTEVLKASRPPTITSVAQTGWGNLPKPIDYKPGGTNFRRLNVDKTEIVPTSPRPTDASPILGKITSDISEGSVNPAMFGNVEGSNIAGFAIEQMIAGAKDTILPYLRCWELFQQLKAQMILRQYKSHILPMGVASTPMEGKYGTSPSADVTSQVLELAGNKVKVELIGVSDQQRGMLVNTLGAEVERGFSSRRFAMEKLGHKDPDRMISDIIVERALEHPEMMENFLIPITFIKQGKRDLADLWVLMVVMPKVQMLMAKMGVGGQSPMAGVQAAGIQPPAPPQAPAMLGPGGPASAPPEANGQSNPLALRQRGRPTGPSIGQGRGPAPTGIMGA